MEKRLNDLVARLSNGQLDRREFLTRMAVIPGGVTADGLDIFNTIGTRVQHV